MAMVLKTIRAATSSWVRIPRPPLTCKNVSGCLRLARPDGRAAELWLLAARRAYQTGALSSAAPMLERAWARTDPGHGVWHEIGRLLVHVLRTSGRVDEALEVGTRLLASATTSFGEMLAQLELARGATSAGRRDEAAAHVDWALRIVPTTPDSPSALIDLAAAEIAVGRGRFRDARTALGTGPGLPVGQVQVGYVQAEGFPGAGGRIVQQPPQRPFPQRDVGPGLQAFQLGQRDRPGVVLGRGAARCGAAARRARFPAGQPWRRHQARNEPTVARCRFQVRGARPPTSPGQLSSRDCED
jgi:hypothetical protein